jgi:hypothetical protein
LNKAPRCKEDEAIKRREHGETLTDIGRSNNVSPTTIFRLTAF